MDLVAGAKRFKSPSAVRDSVGSTGEMPPVLAGLDFATPSLNALKDALPTLSFDEELSDHCLCCNVLCKDADEHEDDLLSPRKSANLLSKANGDEERSDRENFRKAKTFLKLVL